MIKISSRSIPANAASHTGAFKFSERFYPISFMDVKLTFCRHLLLDHYSRPRNPGSMDKKDPAVGTGLVGAPACGDVMKLQIRVDESTGTITDAKFKTFGCGSAIASSSYLTELVKGMRCEFLPFNEEAARENSCSMQSTAISRKSETKKQMLTINSVEDASKIRNVDISKELCLPPVKRMFCRNTPNP